MPEPVGTSDDNEEMRFEEQMLELFKYKNKSEFSSLICLSIARKSINSFADNQKKRIAKLLRLTDGERQILQSACLQREPPYQRAVRESLIKRRQFLTKSTLEQEFKRLRTFLQFLFAHVNTYLQSIEAQTAENEMDTLTSFLQASNLDTFLDLKRHEFNFLTSSSRRPTLVMFELHENQKIPPKKLNRSVSKRKSAGGDQGLKRARLGSRAPSPSASPSPIKAKQSSERLRISSSASSLHSQEKK